MIKTTRPRNKAAAKARCSSKVGNPPVGKSNLHNYFSIVSAKGEHTAYNTVLQVAQILKQNKPFANYIALGCSGGVTGNKLNNMVFVAPVTVTEMNSDREKGELRAQYSILVGYDSNLTFNEMALCANADGSEAVNYAQCETITVSEDTAVSVTVFARIEGEIQVLGGDNPIAHWLLGRGSLAGIFHLAVGSCNYPQYPMHRKNESILESVVIKPQFTNDGLIFEGDITQEKSEFLILLNDQPVLRLRPNYTKALVSDVQVTRNNGNITVFSDYPIRVTKVKVKNAETKDYKLWGFAKAIRDIRALMPFKLKGIAQIRNDVDERYIAAMTENDVVVLEFNDRGARIVMRVKRNGEFTEILQGGDVALWDDSMLRIFRRGITGRMEQKRYALARGEQCAIVRDGDFLHAARLTGNVVERFRIGEVDFEKIDSATVKEGTVLTRNMRNITYLRGTTGVFNLNGALDNLVNYTESTVNAVAPVTEVYKLTDIYMDCQCKSGRKLVYYNGATYTNLLPGQNIVCGGRAFVRYLPNNTQIFGLMDYAKMNINNLLTEPKTSGSLVKDLAVANNWLILLLEDGTVETKYIECKGAALTSPQFSAYESVNYTVEHRDVPFAGEKTCKVRLTLKY